MSVPFPRSEGPGTAKRLLWLLLATVLGAILIPQPLHAGCNVIPGASQIFRGALGSTNRPFTSPGEFVTLRVRPEVCDGASDGFSLDPADHVITVLFTPPGGPVNVVVLAPDCGAIGTCGGASSTTCIDSDAPGPVRVAVADVEDERRLTFRFPDTDGLHLPAADDHTFSGPATIAVTTVGSPLPCGLAAQRCVNASGTPGLLACVDDLFEADGTCRPVPHGIFGHFTALPPPNDYQALCTGGPCTGTENEIRFTTDAAGNLLVPVDWRGILVRAGSVPVPRLLRGTGSVLQSAMISAPIRIPSQEFVDSYTPEGLLLPPIFEPQFDPSATGDVTLFGSTDAPQTVLRFARRSPTFQQCTGGADSGLPCTPADGCPGGACVAAQCTGGARAGSICDGDDDCPGGECGPELFDFSNRFEGNVGPIVIPKGVVCQAPPDELCTVEAEDPVPLDGLVGSPDVFAFVQSEAIEGEDLNGDTDTVDSVVTVRDRVTGKSVSIGAGDEGRAATRVQAPPFSFPAVAVEDDVVAFLEPEPGQNDGAEGNGDGDLFDIILRVFRLEAGSATHVTGISGLGGLEADAAPVIAGRSLQVSGRQVFFRRPEAAGAGYVTSRVSISSAGVEASDQSGFLALSENARFVAFSTTADNLVGPGGDTNGSDDIFVRDRDTDEDDIFDEPGAVATVLVSASSAGVQGNGGSTDPVISADGRFVAFVSAASNLLGPGGDTNGFDDVFVRDRDADEDDTFDEPGAVATVRVSVSTAGAEADASSARPAISANGRFVAFDTVATNLHAGGGAAASYVLVHDRDVDGDSVMDESGATATERVSVDSNEVGLAGAALGPAISGDGRVVAFSNSPPSIQDVFVRDRIAGTTTRASVASDGTAGNDHAVNPSISADGRYVAFESFATNLVAGKTNDCFGLPCVDVYVHDRVTGNTTRVSVSSDGEQSDGDSGLASISPDGRYVAFSSFSTNLVTGDTNGFGDAFIHDRVTGLTARVSVDSAGGEGLDGTSFPGRQSISGDGQHIAFLSQASTLVSPDANAAVDVFVRASSPLSGDLTGDGDIDDTVLNVLSADATDATGLVRLCPAGQVATASGNAAFLRPESAGQTTNAGCNALDVTGPILNGDGDTLDQVVHLRTAAGQLRNLRCAATALALSPTWVGALVSEADQGVDLNGDSIQDDTVAMVHRVAATPGASCTGPGTEWVNTQQAADAVDVVDPAGQGSTLLVLRTQTGMLQLRTLDAGTNSTALAPCSPVAPATCTAGVNRPVVEFVAGPSLVAFRVPESVVGSSLNQTDGDTTDSVLFVYDRATGRLYNTGQAATPCPLEACDPRFPYRVLDDRVKFLTLESEQNDYLNDDEDQTDLIIQVFNPATQTITTIGEVDTTAGTAGDPLQGDPVADPADGAEVFVSIAGGCFEDKGIPCDPTATVDPCGVGLFCRDLGGGTGSCTQDHGVCACGFDGVDCTASDDCPPTIPCVPQRVVAAGRDQDGDGVVDARDNAPSIPNPDQVDSDADGVGDTADLQICGNGVPEFGEGCDDGNTTNGDGCDADCIPSGCGNGIPAGAEGCDDGDTENGDGCDANCTPTGCGNGIATAGELCDDGNATAGDGCEADCTVTVPLSDRRIAATKLSLTRSASGVEKLVFVSKDPLFFPPIDGASDPANGAPGGLVVEIFSAAQPGGAALLVPAGEGRPGWTVTDRAIDSYRFTNPDAPNPLSNVGTVIVKQGKLLKVVAKSTGLALAGPQGAVGIRVTMGSRASCARFGAGTIVKDGANRFIARNAPGEAMANCSSASLAAP